MSTPLDAIASGNRIARQEALIVTLNQGPGEKGELFEGITASRLKGDLQSASAACPQSVLCEARGIRTSLHGPTEQRQLYISTQMYFAARNR